MRVRKSRDEGFAVVMALMITSIVFVIMAGILAQALHNVVQSGYARRRLAAINAAEAGLNWFANQLGNSSLAALGGAPPGALGWSVNSACTNAGSISTSCWYTFSSSNSAAVVASRPEVSAFEIRVLYTSKNPCRTSSGTSTQCGVSNIPLNLATPSNPGVLLLQDTVASPFPDTAYAVIRSIGTSGSVQRVLESYVRIRAIRDNVQGGISSVSLCLGSAAKVTVEGDLSVNNQAVGGSRPSQFAGKCPDTYSTGDLKVEGGGKLILTASAFGGGGGSLSIKGGGLIVDSNAPLSIARDIWSEGAVKIGTGAAATNCPTSGVQQCVGGDVMAASVTLGSNAYVAGDIITCSTPCPPPVAFPEITWNSAEWRAPWQVQEVSTSTGLLATINSTTSPTVFHLTSTSSCDVDFDHSLVPGGVLNIRTDIAIVSRCRFLFQNNSATIQNVGASDHALLLISSSPAAACGTATSPPYGPQDIAIEQNPTLVDVGLFVYTPCILWIGNNQSLGSAVVGQFVARYIIIDNTVNMVENPIGQFVTSIPGQIARFYQDVKFVREIRLSVGMGNLGP